MPLDPSRGSRYARAPKTSLVLVDRVGISADSANKQSNCTYTNCLALKSNLIVFHFNMISVSCVILEGL